MKMHFKMRVATLAVSVALLGGTALVASGQTGAYFSSTTAGAITGSIGTITVINDSTTNIAFTDLLPGTPQTQEVDYHNSGNSPADVWITFNNATALSALNNLGRYGSFTVTSTGINTLGNNFTSSNLDDNAAADACGSLSNSPSTGPSSGCWPVPQQIKIASNVPSGDTGKIFFTFEYAGALGNTPATSWNSWPLPGDNGLTQTYAACETYYGSNPLPAGKNVHQACSNNQVTINAGDSTGNGLPFQLVGTQFGITPGQVGTKF